MNECPIGEDIISEVWRDGDGEVRSDDGVEEEAAAAAEVVDSVAAVGRWRRCCVLASLGPRRADAGPEGSRRLASVGGRRRRRRRKDGATDPKRRRRDAKRNANFREARP